MISNLIFLIFGNYYIFGKMQCTIVNQKDDYFYQLLLKKLVAYKYCI